mgnify:CR=1 FL=1
MKLTVLFDVSPALAALLTREEAHAHRHFSILNQKLDTLMATVQEKLTLVQGQLDTITSAVDGITGDVASLKAQILALQNSLGQLTPEQEAAFDAVIATMTSLATRTAALDAETP